ncbi:MAG: hypothetical protein ACK4OM_06185 [Alphaproteobacteria bacterium]
MKASQNKNKFIKNYEYFQEISLESVSEEESQILSYGANNSIYKKEIEDKKFVKKTPETETSLDSQKKKFTYKWIKKHQDSFETFREIVSSEVFRMFLGEDLAPKYRIIKDSKSDNIYSVTKILNNFRSYCDISKAHKPDFEQKSKGTAEHLKVKSYAAEHIVKTSSFIKTVDELENYHEFIAVNILLGKSDLHSGNWGVVEKQGNKYAATVDHGRALEEVSDISKFTSNGHRKEFLLTKKFIAACRKVIEQYDDQKQEILKAMLKAKNEISEVFLGTLLYVARDTKKRILWEEKQINDRYQLYVDTMESNRKFLEFLIVQIELELTIIEGNPNDFRKKLAGLDNDILSKFTDSEKIVFLMSKDGDRVYNYPKYNYTESDIKWLISIARYEYKFITSENTIKDMTPENQQGGAKEKQLVKIYERELLRLTDKNKKIDFDFEDLWYAIEDKDYESVKVIFEKLSDQFEYGQIKRLITYEGTAEQKKTISALLNLPKEGILGYLTKIYNDQNLKLFIQEFKLEVSILKYDEIKFIFDHIYDQKNSAIIKDVLRTIDNKTMFKLLKDNINAPRKLLLLGCNLAVNLADDFKRSNYFEIIRDSLKFSIPVLTDIIVIFETKFLNTYLASKPWNGFIKLAKPLTEIYEKSAEYFLSNIGSQKLANQLIKSSSPLVILKAGVRAMSGFYRNWEEERGIVARITEALYEAASGITEAGVATASASIATTAITTVTTASLLLETAPIIAAGIATAGVYATSQYAKGKFSDYIENSRLKNMRPGIL